GTTGQSRRMEAFRLSVAGSVPGGVEYSAHVQDIGWTGWARDGAVAGAEGQNKRVEAVRIRLTGEMASYFDIYYRAHSANWGWLGWAKNGESAGTHKIGYALEAFEVAVVVKGSPAPGSTSNAFCDKPPIPATHAAMHKRVANLSSSTNWLIAIDSTNCLVGVYYGSKGNWTNRYMWKCSPGARSTPTVKGLFSVGSRGYVFGSGFSCYYWTQFYGDYLFHSVLYYPGTRTIMDGRMGVQASHGCVRLDINNAKWIYDNIPSRTAVLSY
ncbi:MAG: L,D-transpeptidase family protein, partial [Coriobacteriaceae bacterium]|nr:L,D-transpeptidase family protein [Coriobacteriaceae bacterium]